jgi:hypothetical protein
VYSVTPAGDTVVGAPSVAKAHVEWCASEPRRFARGRRGVGREERLKVNRCVHNNA